MDALPDPSYDANALNDETYQARNPLLPVQPARNHPTELPETEKRKIYEQRKRQKENLIALRAEIDTFRLECDDKIKALSTKYSFDENKVRNDIYNISSFKPERKINTWNAEVAFKSKELRENGEKGDLASARAKVVEEQLQRGGTALPQEKQDQVIKYTSDQRSLKQNGARPTNKSAAMDTSFTSTKILTELRRLNSRTGAAGIVITTRGHVNDSIAPTAFETDNASGFCRKVFGHALVDVGSRLEGWTVLQNESKKAGTGTKELRKKCVQVIIEGLREITGKDDVAMNYQNYETVIVSRHKVHLVGWPPRVPFANPSNISTEHLQRLSDALQSHECHWEVMTREEILRHNEEHDSQLTTGKSASMARKTRSDKGKKRSRGKEDGNTSKKCKSQGKGVGDRAAGRVSRQIPPGPSSQRYIEDSGSDSEHDAE